MKTIIAVANQKGGVGKTTTAVTLAAGLAAMNLRTLLIDLDSQGNCADLLGLPAGNDLYQLLVGKQAMAKVMTQARPNLWLVRSDKSTAELKTILAGMSYRETVLKKLLAKHPFDLVIFDCAPSVDILHQAALVASDFLIVPTKLDNLAIKGVVDVLDSLAETRENTGSGASLLGIIPTFFDRTTSETQAQLANLVEGFQQQVWPFIPDDTKAREAPRLGETLWEYKRGKSRAVVGIDGLGGGYRAVLNRFMESLLGA